MLAAAVYAGEAPPPSPWVAGVSRPITGEEECGDGYAARTVDGRRQVMLCDGLGHGPLAAAAARAAVAEFLTGPPGGPKQILDRVHERIQHTRGVVAGVAEFEPGGGQVRFAGVGNVAACVVDGGQRRAMVSLPGHRRAPAAGGARVLVRAVPAGAWWCCTPTGSPTGGTWPTTRRSPRRHR